MISKDIQSRVYADDTFLIFSQRKNGTRYIESYFGNPCITFDFRIKNKNEFYFNPTPDDTHNYSNDRINFVQLEINKFLKNTSNKIIYFVIKNPIDRAVTGFIEDFFHQVKKDFNKEINYNFEYIIDSNDLNSFTKNILEDQIAANYSELQNPIFYEIIKHFFTFYLKKYVDECNIFTEHNNHYMMLFYQMIILSKLDYKIIDLSDSKTFKNTLFDSKNNNEKKSNNYFKNIIYTIFDEDDELNKKFHNLMFFEQHIYDILKENK